MPSVLGLPIVARYPYRGQRDRSDAMTAARNDARERGTGWRFIHVDDADGVAYAVYRVIGVPEPMPEPVTPPQQQPTTARAALFASLDNHGIPCAGITNFGLRGVLINSDNKYLRYPVNGVLVIVEQGTDLSIKAVFHRLKSDGSLEAPVVVGNPMFTVVP